MAEYEIHLDDETEEWIVLCDRVEVARYAHATGALAHARRCLEQQGDDLWEFGLGVTGLGTASETF